MNDIIVGGKNIILLYSSAEGFKHAFFVVYNSYNDNDKSFYWNNKDILSVTGTIGVFAIELYLKFLSVIETYKVKSHSGKHMKTHNLVDIYNKIKSSPIISNLTTDFHNKEKISLLDFLDNCKNQFEEWRYSYSSAKPLSIHLNQLCTLLNLMCSYSHDAFFKLSNDNDFANDIGSDNSSFDISMVLDPNKVIEEEDL